MLGHQLKENQQVIIQVGTVATETPPDAESDSMPETDRLPEWCNVYERLTGEQIADLDSAVGARANLTRPP